MPIVRRKSTAPLDPRAAGVSNPRDMDSSLKVPDPTGILTRTTFLTTGPLRGTVAQQNYSKQVMQALKQRLHGKIIA